MSVSVHHLLPKYLPGIFLIILLKGVTLPDEFFSASFHTSLSTICEAHSLERYKIITLEHVSTDLQVLHSIRSYILIVYLVGTG